MPGAATADNGWIRFPESQRAPVAAIDAFCDAASDRLIGDVVLVTVCGRGSSDSRMATARGLEQSSVAQVAGAVRQVESQVRRSRQPVTVTDLATDPRTSSGMWASIGLSGLVAWPIIFGEEVLGTLHVVRSGGRPFREEEFADVESLAALAATEVAGVRLEYAEIRHLVDRDVQRAIEEISLGEERVTDLGDLLVRKMRILTGAERAGVMLLEAGGWLQLQDGGFGADTRDCASYRIHVANRAAPPAIAFRSREPVAREYRGRTEDSAACTLEGLFGLRRVMAVPLGGPHRPPWGILLLADKPTPFAVDDVHRARVACSHLASSFSLARTTNQLHVARRTDRLLSDAATDVAAQVPVEHVVSKLLPQLARVATLDAIVVRIDASTSITWPPEEQWPQDNDLREFRTAMSGSEAGARIRQPSRVGDPGASWVVRDASKEWPRPERVGVFRRSARLEESDIEATSRLVRLVHQAGQARALRDHQAEAVRMRERQRLADDLHDDLAQLLFMAQANLDSLAVADPDQAVLATEANRYMRSAQSALRTALTELTGGDRVGRGEEVEAASREVAERYGLSVELVEAPGASDAVRALAMEARSALARVATEALANVAKHAGTAAAVIHLSADERAVYLQVVDEGVGFCPADGRTPGYGLASLRRDLASVGGQLELGTVAGGGARLTAWLPRGRPAPEVVTTMRVERMSQ